MSQPNIVLFMCDQFRGDCLSIEDHPDVKTPFLDSIGNQGVVFENAYSATPSCIPARAALLTGRSQTGHGRVGYQDNVDWDYTHYMAEEFSNANYQTQCIGKMHVHPPRLSCGFQNLKLQDGYLACYRNNNAPYWMHHSVHDDYLFDLQNQTNRFSDVTSSGPECNSWITHPWIYEERLHPTNWVADQSIRFIQTRDYLHGEHSFHSDFSNHYIVTENYKYIWYSQTGKEQFFDLKNDPMETHDAINDSSYQSIIDQLRKTLIQELKDRPEGYSDGTQLIVGQEAVNMIPHRK